MSFQPSKMLSQVPSVQIINRWISEEVICLKEKEAEMLLKYIVLPKLTDKTVTIEEVKNLLNTFRELGFNFNLLTNCEKTISYQNVK